MEEYTIYCTESQAKKALELGAPIEEIGYNCQQGYIYEKVTAEQMIGWLEEQGISVKAMCFSWCNENKPTWQVHAYQSTTNFWDEIAFGHSKSSKEATLAAIDAALDYLIKNKK